MTQQERLTRCEVNIEHNSEAIKENTIAIKDMSKGCLNTQREIRKEVSSLKSDINNGFKDTIREAIEETLPKNITVTTKQGLSLNDKVVVAIITVLGSIIVALLSNWGGS